MIITNDMQCNMYVQDDDFTEGYAYIYIVQLNQTSGVSVATTKIKTKADQEIYFPADQDGFYTFLRIKIPNIQNDSYYTDGKTFYKENSEVELQELIDSSNLLKDYQGFFSTCKLRKCFISLCKSILDGSALDTKRCFNKSKDSELIYKRDLVWSVYNIVQYMLDFGQYMEAQRLLERVNGCNGICSEVTSSSSCGCHGD